MSKDQEKIPKMWTAKRIKETGEGGAISLMVFLLLLILAAGVFGENVQPGAKSVNKSVKQNKRTTAVDKNSQVVQKNNQPAVQKKSGPKSQEKTAQAKTETGQPIKDKAKLQVVKENIFLAEELSLAKNPQYYFVLNLKEKKIELRARGMVLKSWAARDIRYTGPAVPLKVTTLAQKTALKPPKRLLINPAENQAQESSTAKPQEKKEEKAGQEKTAAASGSGSSDNFEVQALEITDMPTSYELIMDNGLQVSIRTKGKEKSRQQRELISWYVLRPIKNLLSSKKEIKPKMIIYFEKERDAQGLYWAFIDGLKGLIWLP